MWAVTFARSGLGSGFCSGDTCFGIYFCLVQVRTSCFAITFAVMLEEV